jgi:hypothetical protein
MQFAFRQLMSERSVTEHRCAIIASATGVIWATHQVATADFRYAWKEITEVLNRMPNYSKMIVIAAFAFQNHAMVFCYLRLSEILAGCVSESSSEVSPFRNTKTNSCCDR